MIVNLNARVLTDQTVFVQFQQDGKAKDGSFPNWWAFTVWLQDELREQE